MSDITGVGRLRAIEITYKKQSGGGYSYNKDLVENDMEYLLNEVRTQQTLIDQQDKEIELLNQSKADVEHNRELLSGEIQLAVRALEWYSDYKNFAYAGMNEMYARSMSEKAQSTLKQINHD